MSNWYNGVKLKTADGVCGFQFHQFLRCGRGFQPYPPLTIFAGSTHLSKSSAFT